MNNPAGNSIVCKSTRVRFTYNDDIVFLKEFLAHNPVQNADGWEVIQRNLELITRKKFLIRTLKHHLQLLIEIWLKKDEVDKKRSGVEEVLSEKDLLLQEISSIWSEYNSTLKRKKTVSKEKLISELGNKARNEYASMFIDTGDHENESEKENNATSIFEVQDHNYFQHVNSEDIQFSSQIEVDSEREREITLENTVLNDESTPGAILKNKEIENILPPSRITKKSNIMSPARKRLHKREPIRKNALSYLSEKYERENELKKRELELEGKKLAIEERRLNLAERQHELDKQRLETECKERLQRIELETEKAQIELHEKRITAQLLQSQQKLIDAILHTDKTNIQV